MDPSPYVGYYFVWSLVTSVTANVFHVQAGICTCRLLFSIQNRRAPDKKKKLKHGQGLYLWRGKLTISILSFSFDFFVFIALPVFSAFKIFGWATNYCPWWPLCMFSPSSWASSLHVSFPIYPVFFCNAQRLCLSLFMCFHRYGTSLEISAKWHCSRWFYQGKQNIPIRTRIQ